MVSMILYDVIYFWQDVDLLFNFNIDEKPRNVKRVSSSAASDVYRGQPLVDTGFAISGYREVR